MFGLEPRLDQTAHDVYAGGFCTFLVSWLYLPPSVAAPAFPYVKSCRTFLVSQSVDTYHLPLGFVSNGAGTVHALQPSLADRTYLSLPRRSCESRGRVEISSSLGHIFCMYELCALSFGRMGCATVSEGGCDSAWREVRVLMEGGVVVG